MYINFTIDRVDKETLMNYLVLVWSFDIQLPIITSTLKFSYGLHLIVLLNNRKSSTHINTDSLLFTIFTILYKSHIVDVIIYILHLNFAGLNQFQSRLNMENNES